MRRHCDGTDPNLTRAIPLAAYGLAGDYTVSPWNGSARPGEVIVNCNCGLRFDDFDRQVIYPHQWLGGGALLYPDGLAVGSESGASPGQDHSCPERP